MPSQDKLIKQGIYLTDSLFDEIIKRLSKGVRSSDTLEAFLNKTKDYTMNNPLVVSEYKDKLLDIILQETNNHKFSRPSQKELTRLTIENRVGNLIVDVGEDIKMNVRDIVKHGYDNNLSQDEIAENISKKVTTIKNKRARAIARTEIARTATASDYVISKERGANAFTVDCRNTACTYCKEKVLKNPERTPTGKGMTGDVEFSIDDVENLPPFHPNCRCVAMFFIKDSPEELISNKQVKINTEIDSDDHFSVDKEKVKNQLRDILPEEFADEGINYIVDVLEKRGNSNSEYGQLFGYKDGKPYSIEFGGSSNESVHIVPKGPYKNPNLMNDNELEDYYHNIEKYTVNYIEGKSNIAIQHNHTKVGLHAPSTDDLLHLIQNDYADFSICISSEEIWIIEHKGNYSLSKQRRIENEILPKENEARNMKDAHSSDEINEWYANQIEESINTSLEDILIVYRVIL